MKKLNLDNVDEYAEGEFNNPKAGGYICIITDVEDVEEKEYLKIRYDIAKGEFKGYYSDLVKKGVMKELPCFFRSYKETALGFFKGFITAVEKTNSGYKYKDTASGYKELVKKGVGLVLGEEEYVNREGKVRTSLKVASVHSAKAIEDGDFKIPEKKTVEPASNPFDRSSAITSDTAPADTTGGGSFFSADDDVPF